MKFVILSALVSILVISTFPSSAEAREVSPFDFQLDKSAVDGTRYSYVSGGTPNAIIKQGENVSLPIIILPATDKPVLVKFHATVGNDQIGPVRMPRDVNATIEPSSIIVTPGKNNTINAVVNVGKEAHSGKYALNIVGEWDAENGFMGSSVMLHVGRDFGPDSMPYNALWTPLKRYESGVNPKDISCIENFMLVIKSKDEMPACVKASSIARLVSQGWILPDIIKVQNSDFLLNYSITGGNMEESKLDSQTLGIMVSLKTTNNGTLTVTIPKALLDMTHDPGSHFMMLADGQETEFKQIRITVSDRTFSIPFQNGTSKLMILVSHY